MYRVPKYLLDIVLMSVFILHTTFLNWWETTFIYLLIHRMICIRVTLSLSHGGWHPKKERKKDPRGLRLSVLHAKRVSVLLCHFISFHPQTARGDRHVTSPGPRTKSCTFLQWSTNPILAWESGYIYIYICISRPTKDQVLYRHLHLQIHPVTEGKQGPSEVQIESFPGKKKGKILSPGHLR